MKNTNNITGDKIPFFPAALEYKNIRSSLHEALDEVGNSGKLVLGTKVCEFEQSLANFVQRKYSVSCGSGTDAITLALKSLNIGVGDEVIVPANSYPTVFGVALSGACPKLVDVEQETGHIQPLELEKTISKKTKAAVVVHLYGMSANLTQLKKICKRNNIFLIEDCAQSFGTTYKEKPVGSFGDLAIFSFYPTKNLGAYGDGGAVVTDNYNWQNKLRMLRMYGEKGRYDSQFLGQNSRLDELQAAFLLVKMKHLQEWTNTRRLLAKIYNQELSSISEIKLIPNIPERKHVYHIFTIRTRKRDLLRMWLNQANIETGIHYPKPIHHTKAFSSLGVRGDFPIAENWSNEELSLPLHPFLTERQVYYVCNKVKEFFK